MRFPPEGATFTALEEGLALIIDLSNYCLQVQDASRRGIQGLEEIASKVNLAFTPLVDLIHAWGGQILNFPGDAIIALWLEDRERGAHCAQALLGAAGPFALKLGLGLGPLEIHHLSHGEHKRLLVRGAALERMGQAERQAQAGEIWICEACAQLLKESWNLGPEEEGFYQLLKASPGTLPKGAKRALSVEQLSELLPYLPQALRQMFEGGGAWLGAFLHLPVIFVRLEGVRSGDLPALFSDLMDLLDSLEVSLIRLGQDDKGLNLLASPGLPQSHEDDPQRALDLAFKLLRLSPVYGIRLSLGLSLGRPFCGPLGSPKRRDYSLVGESVNRAARLMSLAEGRILCDAEMARACGLSQIHERRQLKGFEAPLEIYAPQSLPPRKSLRLPRASLQGRGWELERGLRWLKEGCPKPLLLIAEAGLGKSALLEQLLEQAEALGWSIASANADPLQPPHKIWGDLLSAALGSTSEIIERLEAMELRTLGALLGPVLGLGLEISEDLESLEAEDQAAQVQALILALFQARSAEGPLLLALEDLQHLDSASWRLLERLNRAGLALLMTTRLLESCSPTVQRFLERLDILRLRRLSGEEIQALARQRLGVKAISQRLSELINQKVQGNPHFCEQLILGLREQGLISIEAGVARKRGFSAEEVPNSIAQVLNVRLRHLSAPLHLCLKAASVIGAHFSLEQLRVVHPSSITLFQLEIELGELCKRELLLYYSGNYHFYHTLARDLSYQSLLFRQRREGHQRLVEWMEAKGDQSPLLLLYHWRRTREPQRGLSYVEPAALDLLRYGGYSEALDVLEFGLSEVTSTKEQALWLKLRGEALVALGRHEEAQIALEKSMRALAQPIPQGKLKLLLAMVWESLYQLKSWCYSARPWASSERARLRLAAANCEQLGYIYHASGDSLRGAYISLKMLNLGEHAGPCPELGRACAIGALSASFLGRETWMRYYIERAREVAQNLSPRENAWVEWILSLTLIGRGHWKEAEPSLQRTIPLGRRLLDPRLEAFALQTLGMSQFFRGDYSGAKASNERVLQIAIEHDNRLWEAWARNGLSEIFSSQERWKESCEQSLQAKEILKQESDWVDEIRAGGVLARALLALGRKEAAKEEALLVFKLSLENEFVGINSMGGLIGICEVFGALKLSKTQEKALKLLGRFSRIFPTAAPRYHLIRAQFELNRGKRRRFRREIKHSEALGKKLGMEAEQRYLKKFLETLELEE